MSTVPNAPYLDPPPPYPMDTANSPAIHQQGSAGGKPIYVQGPAPPSPNVYYTQNTNPVYPPQQVLVTQPTSTQYVIPVTEQPYRRGMCPACRRGVLVERPTCLGIFFCIIFFPLGILCCLVMREKTCSYCGLTYN